MSAAPYVYRPLSGFERVIVLSDIHGDAAGFRRVLEAAAYSARDCLVVVGDFLEKGDHCLPLLREVMQVKNLFAVAGNNDVAFALWERGQVTDEEMHQYALHAEKSILHEMAAELGLPWDTLPAFRALKEAIFRAYAPMLRWLEELPYILETEFAVFVHAGLRPGPLTAQQPDDCLCFPRFAAENHPFPKLTVVGHWPVSNYSTGPLSLAPCYNPRANTLSIDGANSLKSWGQLNYLIFGADRPRWRWGSVDALPRVRLLEAQEPNEAVSLHFPDTRLTPLGEGRYFVPALGRALTLPPERTFTYRGGLYAADLTTYRLPAAPGDIAALCEREEGRILVKKESILGWYEGKWEPVPDMQKTQVS